MTVTAAQAIEKSNIITPPGSRHQPSGPNSRIYDFKDLPSPVTVLCYPRSSSYAPLKSNPSNLMRLVTFRRKSETFALRFLPTIHHVIGTVCSWPDKGTPQAPLRSRNSGVTKLPVAFVAPFCAVRKSMCRR